MNKQTYLRAVDKLLDAYNNGTLEHGNCAKCAVGNLLGTSVWASLFITHSDRYFGTIQTVAESNSIIVVSQLEGGKSARISEALPWLSVESITKVIERQKRANDIIANSGFTKEELMRIESVFEQSIAPSFAIREYLTNVNKKRGQYIGLCAVLNVMREMVNEPVETESRHAKVRLDEIYDTVKVLV